MSLEQKRYFQSGILHERSRIMEILGDVAQNPEWALKELIERIDSEPPGDARTEEVATLRVKKVFYYDEPALWEVDVINHEGLQIGEATGPTFSSVFDSAYDIFTGSSGFWTEYDANKEWSQHEK
jgi:hypothetical protein